MDDEYISPKLQPFLLCWDVNGGLRLVAMIHAYRFKASLRVVRTKFKTHNKPGPSGEFAASVLLRFSSESNASTGDIVLKEVWFRKNMVQSSMWASAPSGSIDIARTLPRFHQQES